MSHGWDATSVYDDGMFFAGSMYSDESAYNPVVRVAAKQAMDRWNAKQMAAQRREEEYVHGLLTEQATIVGPPRVVVPIRVVGDGFIGLWSDWEHIYRGVRLADLPQVEYVGLHQTEVATYRIIAIYKREPLHATVITAKVTS